MQTFKNITLIQYILIITAFTQSLHCMEIWYNPTTKDDIHNALAQRYFSHNSICALALVSKQWNAFIKKTAQLRKKFIEAQKEFHQTHSGYTYGTYHPTIWHTHNSAYTHCVEGNKNCSPDKIQIILYLVHLDGNGKIRIHTKHGFSYSIYSQPKPYEVLYEPVFNAKGGVNFYILEHKYVTSQVTEYSLSYTHEAEVVTAESLNTLL